MYPTANRMRFFEWRTKMRKLAVTTLAGLLMTQSVPAHQSAVDSRTKQNIAALPPKAHVEVQLGDGSSVRGRIVSRTDNDFVIKRDSGAGTQTIRYDQVRSVSQVKGNHSRTKWIIIGAVAGAAVVVAIVGILVARSGY